MRVNTKTVTPTTRRESEELKRKRYIFNNSLRFVFERLDRLSNSEGATQINQEVAVLGYEG